MCMLVSDAARLLEMNPQILRLALQQKKFSFGVAIRTSPNRYTYYINERLLDQYLKGSGYEKETVNADDPRGGWNNVGGV